MERQFSNNHRYQQPGDLLPDNMYATQGNSLLFYILNCILYFCISLFEISYFELSYFQLCILKCIYFKMCILVNDHPRCNPRWNYRPRFAEQGDWEGNYEFDQQSLVSPRGAGHYQPSGHHLQRKTSNRSPLTQSNSYKVRESVRRSERV